MLSFFKMFFKYIFILLVISTSSYAIKIESTNHAVDVAGKQRMFTQRMLKDYSMIGMKNSFGNPKEDLKKIMGEFENHLQSLYDFTSNKDIKKSIDRIKKLWIPIKEVLQAEAKRESAGKLQEDLEVLLEESNRVTVLFSKETGEVAGDIINISGRQRMLSQRMASLYMLKVWGINDDKFSQKMDSAMSLFKTSLKKLQKSELNTDEITNLLSKVEKSFMFFEFMNRSSNTFIPTLIYKKSDDILKNMNTATGKYVVASKK